MMNSCHESTGRKCDVTSTPKSMSEKKTVAHVFDTPVKYTDPMPITPMPKFDDLDTPEVCRRAKKYGMKRTLGKTRLKTKLMEVYQYNHQLSPSSDQPGTTGNTIQTKSIGESPKPLPESSRKSPIKSASNNCIFKNDLGVIDLTNTENIHSAKVDFHKIYELGQGHLLRPSRNCSISTFEDGDECLKFTENSDQTEISGILEHDVDQSLQSVHEHVEEIAVACKIDGQKMQYQTPTISLLDSSTESFAGNTNASVDLGRKEIIANNSNTNHTTNLKFAYKLNELPSENQKLKKAQDCIDLTVSDMSCDNVEHSVSDIFDVSAVSGLETSHRNDLVERGNVCDADVVEQSVMETQLSNYCDSSDQKKQSSDESSDEIYNEREKFHQSLFGCLDEDSTDKEESDGDCPSLFHRILNKKKQARQASTPTSENVDIMDSNSVLGAESNQYNDNDDNGKRETEHPDGSSPIKKTRKTCRKKSSSSKIISTETKQHKSKNSQLTKENMELEMCNAIKTNHELHTQILFYRPIYFSQFKTAMKNYGVQVSSNDLRDFLDNKGITFSTADENRHKGPRVVRKKTRAKPKS